MRLFAVWLLFVLLTLPSFSQFEGVLDMRMTTGRPSGESRQVSYTLMVKENKVAADVREAEGAKMFGKIIYRGDKNLTWVIDDAHKSYMEIELNGETPEQEQETKGEQEGGPKVHKTGKTESILGYTCDEWIVEDSDAVTSVWGTPKLGDMYDGLQKAFGQLNRRGPMSGSASSWENELAKIRVFPLKIVRSEGGNIVQTQEVTKIEPKSLAASVFEVPEDYKKQEMGPSMEQMMDALKNYQGQNGGPPGGIDKEALQKMLKELQEKMKQGGGNAPDSSQHDDQ